MAEDVPNKLQMWDSLGFHVIFKDNDWRGTAKGEELQRTFAAVGVDVVYFPYTIHTSSTMLRGALERAHASWGAGSGLTPLAHPRLPAFGRPQPDLLAPTPRGASDPWATFWQRFGHEIVYSLSLDPPQHIRGAS